MPVRVRILKCDPTDFGRPGPWWRPLNGKLNPMLRCPNGHTGFLTEHEITADGNVNPSIVCPEEDCDWHIWGVLVGWDQGHRPHTD